MTESAQTVAAPAKSPEPRPLRQFAGALSETLFKDIIANVEMAIEIANGALEGKRRFDDDARAAVSLDQLLTDTLLLTQNDGYRIVKRGQMFWISPEPEEEESRK